MPFRYRTFQINEIVGARKVLRSDQPLKFKSHGERGKSLDADVDLKSGTVLDLRLSIRAGRFADPTTYEAALILADQRIRGVGYSATRRSRFYRAWIPAGWHQNIIDPNLPTRDDDYNRHESLVNFRVTDLADFLRRVCDMWHIELETRETLL